MRTSLAVPDALLAEFDDTWQAEGIDSRSRAIREAMAEYVERHRDLETVEGPVTGAIVFDYQHDRVIEALHDVQHDYQDVIIATSHAHQGEWCLESVFCRGPADRFRELVYELTDFDGVGRVKTMMV